MDTVEVVDGIDEYVHYVHSVATAPGSDFFAKE